MVVQDNFKNIEKHYHKKAIKSIKNTLRIFTVRLLGIYCKITIMYSYYIN